MSYEIRADYSQQYLLPPSLEDWVGPHHPARFLRQIVDSLDLKELGFAVRRSLDGRPNYAADLLLKAWLYGYMNRIRSTRHLELACNDNLGLVWLTGRQAPDHNTLWRFWRDHREEIGKLLKAVSRLALRAGLIELVLHAVDGTKVIAQASKEGVLTRERLEKELAVLDTAIEEVIQEVDHTGQLEQSGKGYRLPEQWEAAVCRREQLREALAEVELGERAQVQPLEPKARMAKTRSAGSALTHNAQAVVDSKSGLIVASEVIGENTDNHAMVDMLEEVKETLGAAAEQTVLDAGYYSGEELERAEQKGLAVLVTEQNAVARKGDGSAAYHHSQFRYDEQRDCCICPQGAELKFERRKEDLGRGEEVRLFRCRVFRSCLVREQCSGDPRGRSIAISRYHGAIIRQREKQRAAAMQAQLKKRAQIVEPVFGIIKEIMGFRRFTVAGLEKVRAQWTMVCLGYNLRKLYAVWRAAVIAAERSC